MRASDAFKISTIFVSVHAPQHNEHYVCCPRKCICTTTTAHNSSHVHMVYIYTSIAQQQHVMWYNMRAACGCVLACERRVHTDGRVGSSWSTLGRLCYTLTMLYNNIQMTSLLRQLLYSFIKYNIYTHVKKERERETTARSLGRKKCTPLAGV